jgi:hypothetical protein
MSYAHDNKQEGYEEAVKCFLWQWSLALAWCTQGRAKGHLKLDGEGRQVGLSGRKLLLQELALPGGGLGALLRTVPLTCQTVFLVLKECFHTVHLLCHIPYHLLTFLHHGEAFTPAIDMFIPNDGVAYTLPLAIQHQTRYRKVRGGVTAKRSWECRRRRSACSLLCFASFSKEPDARSCSCCSSTRCLHPAHPLDSSIFKIGVATIQCAQLREL